MSTIPEKDFNQPYIKSGCSIGLSGLGAVCGTKALQLAGIKLNRKISLNAVKKVRANNDIYKNASKKVLEREQIGFVDLAVTKDAFQNENQTKTDKIKPPQSKKIKSYIDKILSVFVTKEKKRQSYYTGNNACVSNNKVHANFEKAAFMIPHEIGHVKNFQNGGIAKYLQTLRKTRFKKYGLGLAFCGAILLTPPKENKTVNSEQYFLVKTKNFIKNHCVAIGAVAILPTILEEGLASLKADKLMKDVLSKSDLKAMNRTNFGAWLSYVFANFALIGGIYIADKIRNHTAPEKSTGKNIA